MFRFKTIILSTACALLIGVAAPASAQTAKDYLVDAAIASRQGGQGKGVKEDLLRGVNYYWQAAIHEHGEAQAKIGMFFLGTPVADKDFDAARYWFTRSSSNSHRTGTVLTTKP